MPSGLVISPAGQRQAQFTIQVPSGALGSAPSKNVEVQISGPNGTLMLTSTAAATVFAPPAPGTPPVPKIAHLTPFGNFTQDPNHPNKHQARSISARCNSASCSADRVLDREYDKCAGGIS